MAGLNSRNHNRSAFREVAPDQDDWLPAIHPMANPRPPVYERNPYEMDLEIDKENERAIPRKRSVDSIVPNFDPYEARSHVG
jgi:hypothetical protein